MKLFTQSGCLIQAAAVLVEPVSARPETAKKAQGPSTAGVQSELPPDQRKSAAVGAASYRWIVNPVFDLLFVCGLFPAALIAINVYFAGWTVPTSGSGPVGRALLIAVLLGQHMFADAHNMATYFRIWGSSEDRERFKFYRTWLVYSCIPIFVLGAFYPRVTGFYVYLYLIAVYWHYAAQVFGLSLIYCIKRSYPLNPLERKLYKGFFYAMAGAVIIRFLTFRELSPPVWFGVPLPFWGPLPRLLYVAVIGAFAVYSLILCIIVARKALVERRIFPLPNVLMIGTLAWLGFSLGPANALLWLFVPSFFHGTQYMAVTIGYQVREKAYDKGISFSDLKGIAFAGPAVTYFWTALITGTFFYLAVPTVLSQIGFDYAIIAGLVLAVINYHHFITDAAIWRLRDPRCRKILLG